MKIYFRILSILLYTIFFVQLSYAQNLKSKDYSKKEVYITMRDGIKLFTSIYSPKNASKYYPVLVSRTTYSCFPYGQNKIPQDIMYNPDLVAKGYIFIFQDVRGRWMSEGEFENTKPPYSFWDKEATDEVTDAWDTFEWIKNNVDNFNGNIGVYGNSYLGWSTLTAAVANHPSVKAVLAMAPVTDFFFEDFTRYGLVAINYAPILNAFGIHKKKPTSKKWYTFKDDYTINSSKRTSVNYYNYFLDKFTVKNLNGLIDKDNFFWNNLMAHPNYDDYRKKRNWLNYLKNIKSQVLIAGGWNDEQNLYGIINSFKTINNNCNEANVKFVMGPWAHSHPKERPYKYYLGDIFYGYNLSIDYHKEVQVLYFEYYLKDIGEELNFKARIFDTGKKKWFNFDKSPFHKTDSIEFYLSKGGLMSNNYLDTNGYSDYISDPFHPVPLLEEEIFQPISPKYYMTDDQRHVSKRPDVLTYKTEPLKEDITILGKPNALIQFETDHTAADIYVKIIDVYPMDRKPEKEDKEGLVMNGYQQLVRMGYIRGRFRESFDSPKPFSPNQKSEVNVPMLELFHTFKKGHRIMIQIQSSNFPLFDINPQNYIENVYDAQEKDFSKAIHKVYNDSKLVLPIYNY